MTRRWIIRTLFIGLLQLTAGNWLWSYRTVLYLDYASHIRRLLSVETFDGEFHLSWFGRRGARNGWPWGLWEGDSWIEDRTAVFERDFGDNSFFGFLFSIGPDLEGGPSEDFGRFSKLGATVPLWLPTTFSAALLWLVWRKTRPKPNGFPVEGDKKRGHDHVPFPSCSTRKLLEC